ncbi:hypothetical protein C942_04107 [Photobacterium marinum]|uniref:Uncharacterized protein n=1 Tax=Photobacterium marinum TaxID=1056511 RepID=L8J4E1_9GAMM|nr:zinc ribbon domain-containing protein [Photobacterium marinum]ELR63093.1 hypothetical protein C942_04107 [Photobacterium marinum]
MIIVLWLVFAIFVGIYANSKGRSGFGYFLLSLLLSPLIGFIIALVVSPIDENVEVKELASGRMKKCPKCAELVKREALLCKHCHSDLSECGDSYQDDLKKTETFYDPRFPKRNCPNCGEVIKKGRVYCFHCKTIQDSVNN